MDTQIKIPDPPKPKVLLWADVSYNDMEEIEKTHCVDDLERVLGRVFRIDIPEPRRGILLELYVQTVLFCRRSSFSREQTSALLSIVKSMHQANTETSLNNMEECFEYCSELLLCHSIRRPPFSVNLFTFQEMNQVLTYIRNTYIRHYNLYKYIFTPRVRLNLSLSYHGVPEDDVTTKAPTPPEGEKESATQPEEPSPAETQEPQRTEPIKTPPDSKAALRAIIQQAVGEEGMRVSRQMERRLKEATEKLNNALTSLQLQPQGKK